MKKTVSTFVLTYVPQLSFNVLPVFSREEAGTETAALIYPEPH
jgi:hypothetical protein